MVWEDPPQLCMVMIYYPIFWQKKNVKVTCHETENLSWWSVGESPSSSTFTVLMLPPCGLQTPDSNTNDKRAKLQFSCTSLIYQFFIFTTNTLSSFSLWYSLKYFYTQPFFSEVCLSKCLLIFVSLFWTFYNLLHL